MMIERAGLHLLRAAVIAVLALATGYAFLAAPSSDDFCFGLSPTSPLAIANGLYFTWSGRWLGNLIEAAATQSVDLMTWRYGALSAASFLLWFAGFYAIAAAALVRHRLPAAILMLAVFWSANPAPMEVFYWLTGAVYYAVPFALGAAAIFLLSRGSLLAVIPMVAATAVNEIAGAAFLAGSLPFLRRREVQIVFAAVFVATVAVAFAPGHFARIDTTEDTPLPRLLFYLFRPYDSPWAYMADARLLVFAALVAAIPKPDAPFPWRIVIGGLMVVLVVTAAVTFGASMAPQGRVLAFLFAITVGGVFVLSLSLHWKAPPQVLAGVLALVLVASPSVRAVLGGPVPIVQKVPCGYSFN